MGRPHVADQLIEEVESLHLNKRGYPASSFQEALATVIEMSQPAKLEEKRLVVSSAYPNDSGKGIARLHPDTLEQLSIMSGEIVQIQGEATTVAAVKEMDGPDASRGTIRIDGFTRENADVEVDGFVVVHPIQAKDATSVEFELPETAHSQLDIGVTDWVPDQQAMLDRSMTSGDTVPVPARSDDPFNIPPGKAVPLRVVKTEPDGAVTIAERTEIRVQ